MRVCVVERRVRFPAVAALARTRVCLIVRYLYGLSTVDEFEGSYFRIVPNSILKDSA